MDSLQKELDKRPQVALAAVVIQEGQVLLGKRIGQVGNGTWASPGGHLEYGESVESCASRELLEETGLSAKTLIPGPYTNKIIAPKNQHYVTLYVIVPEFEGIVQCLEPEKCMGWEWFDIDHLPSPLLTSFHSFIQNGGRETLKALCISHTEKS